ncbi:MAG: hypothetical protein IBGAMO2_150023 [Arenicellales bacterium IbO2]|nr:MAG: hypothetical protein IBGAMO2_150023 [Arenicellales bacterium IbO2]
MLRDWLGCRDRREYSKRFFSCQAIVKGFFEIICKFFCGGIWENFAEFLGGSWGGFGWRKTA